MCWHNEWYNLDKKHCFESFLVVLIVWQLVLAWVIPLFFIHLGVRNIFNMTFLIRFWHPIVGEGKFISVDALFGCVCKCSAGTSGKSSNHGEELFISQEKVDAFLANYSKRPSSKSMVCEPKDFFSYFVFCCIALTFCYPSVLIPLLNHCNERPKVTIMFVTCNNDVSVE